MSCDLLPTEVPGPHIQDDVLKHLEGWDLIIAHPECTYLANSGVRWLFGSDHTRQRKMREAAMFFRSLWDAPCDRVAIENPVMHKHAIDAIGLGRPTFTIQPYDFGSMESKRTCFWTRGLYPLNPTHSRPARVKTSVLSEGPGPDRKKNRSRTFPELADAMAKQWGMEHPIMFAKHSNCV